MRKKFLHIILISVMAGTMLVGCANENTSSDQPSENISATTTENSSQLTEGESTSSESTESVSEETSSNVTESVSTESEVVDDNNSEETKEEFTESATTETEEVTKEIVASGFLEDADIEWKIVGTTLYVSGDGEIPGFSDREEQFRDWQLYKDIVEKIIIEDGITKIGKKNFVGFVKTKEVIFSDSVTELGEMAFYHSGLENIDFNNINKLGKFAFSNSHNLKSVVIPGTIKNIPVSCFYYCNNLTEIYIDEGVETISQGALDVSNGQNITIHLPSSISNIHGEAWGIGLTVYVKSGSYAETFVQEAAQRENLTVIVE